MTTRSDKELGMYRPAADSIRPATSKALP